MGTFFELGKDKAAKVKGWAPFISCARYSEFFGDFRCGALLFMVIRVIYKYKNR